MTGDCPWTRCESTLHGARCIFPAGATHPSYHEEGGGWGKIWRDDTSDQARDPSNSTPRRWTLQGRFRPAGVRIPLVTQGPPLESNYDTVEVMPVSEYEQLLKMVAGAVELWDEAHREDNAIALGAAFVGLRAALEENTDA